MTLCEGSACKVEIASPSNNGMHPTRDTMALIYINRAGRAGDAGR
jgi:hypothetical protein